jgi:hypothetical protein
LGLKMFRKRPLGMIEELGLSWTGIVSV